MGHLEVLKYFLKLRKEQWYPPEKLQEIQDQRLEEILKHASNSEFYSFLNDGCEFSEIPITTKEEIKSHKEKVPLHIAQAHKKAGQIEPLFLDSWLAL